MSPELQELVEKLEQRIGDLEAENRRLREAGEALRQAMTLSEEFSRARIAEVTGQLADLRARASSLAADKKKLLGSASYKVGWILVGTGMRVSRALRISGPVASLDLSRRVERGYARLRRGRPVSPTARVERALAQHVYAGAYRIDLSDAAPLGETIENRILHLLEYSLPHVQNGYTVRSIQVVRAQKDNGWDPMVVTRPGFPSLATPAAACEVVGGVPHFRLPGAWSEGVKQPLTEYLRTYVRQAAKVVESVKPSVIHAASNFRNAYAAKELARNYRLPFVYEVRGLWEETRVANGSLRPEDEQYVNLVNAETTCMREADAVVTLSATLRDELVRRGIAREKIFLVPNGVELDQPVAPVAADLRASLGLSDRFVVSYIGSVSRLESLHVLIEAMAIAGRQRSDIAALIVGDGAELDNLRRAAALAGVESSVRFTGAVPREEIAAYYAASDAVVCTRGNDRVCRLVTPLKLYEAMLFGKPVVVTDVPALREMVDDGVTGLVVPPADPGGLARAIAELCDQPAERRALAERARSWVRAHRSWSQVAIGYRAAYDHARAAVTARGA